MSFKKKITSLALCSALVLSNLNFAFADSSRVVTLGVDLTQEQKNTMLNYFGVKSNEVVILDVNNQEERKYLEGVATESQIGNRTLSCAYVEPLNNQKGINVKTANLTWVTSSMIATTLSTAGLEDANVIVAAPFPVSGTGGLTGIMKAFEDATGEALDEEKKELATEELVATGDLAQELGGESGQDKAAGIVNDIKTEIIKNNTSDITQIADTIVNITNNYNVTLSDEQMQKLEELMLKISEQKYDYDSLKNTLDNVSNSVEENLDILGENVSGGGFFAGLGDMFSGIGDFFSNLFGGESSDLGILENTNDELLGEDAQIDATDKDAVNLPSSEEVEGFFSKIMNWVSNFFDGLFGGSDKDTETTPDNNTDNIAPEDNSNGDITSPEDTLEEDNSNTNEESTIPDSDFENFDTPSTEEPVENEVPSNTDNNVDSPTSQENEIIEDETSVN